MCSNPHRELHAYVCMYVLAWIPSVCACVCVGLCAPFVRTYLVVCFGLMVSQVSVGPLTP